MEINSNAPIVSRHEIAIIAPPESVWRVFTDIDSWPEWTEGDRRDVTSL